ncbi:MAG: DUF1580 domain-containing protein [Planctomycetaceae bacterium]|nr:DUF1580 domain-containing protein [Planctomycetaceae bacterium]
MSIDLFSHHPLRIASVPNVLPQTRKGKRVHHASVYRWWARGVSGIKLETIIISGERYTSREALQQFFEAVTKARDGARESAVTSAKTPPPKSPAARRKSNRDAERALIQRGA